MNTDAGGPEGRARGAFGRLVAGVAGGSVGGRLRVGATVATVTVVAAAALLHWDGWFVNYDGGFYLALARNLRHGVGYVFPDGTPATFRGPGYAGLLAFGWLFLPETARSAIWVSRAALLLDVVLVALVAWRLTGRHRPALVAGILVAVQPLALVSGARFFAPDGAAAAFVLAALLVLWWRPERIPRRWRLVGVGVLLGAAFLVKEAALLGLLLPPAWVAGHPRGGPRRAVAALAPLTVGAALVMLPWLAWAAAAGSPAAGVGLLPAVAGVGLLVVVGVAAGRRGGGGVDPARRRRRRPAAAGVLVVALVVLLVAGATPIHGAVELAGAVRDELAIQLYGGTAWGVLLPGLLLALGWAALRRDDAAAFAGTLLVAVGVALLLDAAATGLGVRNAYLLLPGLALLLASATEAALGTGRRLLAAGAVVVVAGVLLGSVQATERLDTRARVQDLTLEGPVTVAAASWLAGHAAGETVAGTPLAFSSLWRLADAGFRPRLVPFLVAAPAGGEFRERVDWAGTVPAAPVSGEQVTGLHVTRTRRGAVAAGLLAELLDGSGARYLVVTGNARFPSSVFDGGILLPLLEASPSARAVYRSDPAAAQWVVVYALRRPFLPGSVPRLVHVAFGEVEPSPLPGATVLDDAAYAALVRDVMGGRLSP